MKNQIHQSVNTISGLFVVLLGGLITSSLLLLNYFNIFHLDVEIVFAPFIVITLLTYGDKLLVFLFLSPISFASKLIIKIRGFSQSQQQQLSLKKS